jgi:hypothetical protein
LNDNLAENNSLSIVQTSRVLSSFRQVFYSKNTLIEVVVSGFLRHNNNSFVDKVFPE